MLTLEIMRQQWPKGNAKVPGLIEGIVAAAPVVFPKYGLTTSLEIAHAMAQFSHECGAGAEMVESTHYSAARAAEVWPLRPNDKAAFRHFADAADCYAKAGSFAGDAQFTIKLIDLVYGTRMGNRPGTHDGSLYIGRGLPQTTGHDGYAKLGATIGVDLLANPDLVISPALALECGIGDFVLCGCLPFARQDNLLGVSSMLNVGHLVTDPGAVVGYAERGAWLERWKAALAGAEPLQAVAPAALPAPAVALPAAVDRRAIVMRLQKALADAGFDPGPIDGAIGTKTVKAFQAAYSIDPVDGVVGAKTQPLLSAALNAAAAA